MKKKIKLGIIGSRSLHDYKLIKKGLDFAHIKKENIKLVISGGARGVDTAAKWWAENNKIKFKEIPAEWSNLEAEPCVIGENKYGKFNKMAGFNRNTQIAEEVDCLLAIWDGESRGTQDTIEKVKNLGKNFWVYEVDIPISEYVEF